MASCFALFPASVVLFEAKSALVLPYWAALVVSIAYHRADEKRFVELDHACAYSVIAANLWMAAHSPLGWVIAGTVSIALGLGLWALAKVGPYAPLHSAWHVLAGLGGLFLALGYAAP